jgi:hypothetical protein
MKVVETFFKAAFLMHGLICDEEELKLKSGIMISAFGELTIVVKLMSNVPEL